VATLWKLFCFCPVNEYGKKLRSKVHLNVTIHLIGVNFTSKLTENTSPDYKNLKTQAIRMVLTHSIPWETTIINKFVFIIIILWWASRHIKSHPCQWNCSEIAEDIPGKCFNERIFLFQLDYSLNRGIGVGSYLIVDVTFRYVFNSYLTVLIQRKP